MSLNQKTVHANKTVIAPEITQQCPYGHGPLAVERGRVRNGRHPSRYEEMEWARCRDCYFTRQTRLEKNVE